MTVRYSLRQLCVGILVMGTLGLAIRHWNPWDLETTSGIISANSLSGIYNFSMRQTVSPDGDRTLASASHLAHTSGIGWDGVAVYAGRDTSSCLYLITMDSVFDATFITADEIKVVLLDDKAETGEVRTYRRRHPEYWWGHFCQPEVWVLSIGIGLYAWIVYGRTFFARFTLFVPSRKNPIQRDRN